MRRLDLVNVCALTAAILWSAPAAALTDAQRCEAAKLKRAGQYNLCRLEADAKSVKTGSPADYTRCNAKLIQKWAAAESISMCPTTGDASSLQALVTGDANFVALKLSGVRFVDNGDGTVTDTQTGLMWEKKDDGGGLHDRDNVYEWFDAMSLFLADVNGVSGDGTTQPGLGGYSDWRMPNTAELKSILLEPHPCSTNPCIDPIFGPTSEVYCWSSTRDTTHPEFAWGVFFDTGLVDNDDWSKTYCARAVRGGS